MQKNRKYSAWSFVFCVLFDQFKFFLNLFYLFLTLTQFVPVFKVGEMFTYVLPLAICIGFTMFKELVDDLKRR